MVITSILRIVLVQYLVYRVVSFIGYPDVGAVEADAMGMIPDSDGIGNGAGGGINFAY